MTLVGKLSPIFLFKNWVENFGSWAIYGQIFRSKIKTSLRTVGNLQLRVGKPTGKTHADAADG